MQWTLGVRLLLALRDWRFGASVRADDAWQMELWEFRESRKLERDIWQLGQVPKDDTPIYTAGFTPDDHRENCSAAGPWKCRCDKSVGSPQRVRCCLG